MSGSILLGGYYYLKPSATVANYFHTRINYTRIDLIKSADKIVLVSNSARYGLSIPLINSQKEVSPEEVAEKLSLSSEAEIWLTDENSTDSFIRGIKTDHYFLPPQVGINEDIKDDASIVEICSWFFIAGLLAVVVSFFKYRSEKRSVL